MSFLPFLCKGVISASFTQLEKLQVLIAPLETQLKYLQKYQRFPDNCEKNMGLLRGFIFI